MRKPILSAMAFAIVISASSTSFAACQLPDGSLAPEPGYSEDATKSLEWGPELARRYAALSEGDKSGIQSALKKPNSAMMTARCSPNDLFWTHVSLVGWSAEYPEALAGQPKALADRFRAFEVTPEGYQMLPALIATLDRR